MSDDVSYPTYRAEKGYSSEDKSKRKVSIGYTKGQFTTINVTDDQNTQIIKFEYDNKNLLKKRLLPTGEELTIIKRDKAGRPTKVSLNKHANGKTKSYTFRYDWEGNTTEIVEGEHKVIMEYNTNTLEKSKNTTVHISQKRRQKLQFSKQVLDLLFSTAYAAPPSKTTITGLANQNNRISTFLEFNNVNQRVQKAESATLQNYLPSSLKQSTGITYVQCTSHKELCAKIEEGIKYAEVSKCVYDIRECIDRSKPKSKWTRVTAQDLNIDPELLNDGEYGDYHAEVLFNGKEYVLAFEGTANAGDWKDNLGQGGIGVTTKQYEKAMELARSLKEKHLDFTITGHSLGGGLATAAALATGKKAVVFNAASLHPDFIKIIS